MSSRKRQFLVATTLVAAATIVSADYIYQAANFLYWCEPYRSAELPDPTGHRKIVAYHVVCGAPLRKNPVTHVSLTDMDHIVKNTDQGNILIASGIRTVSFVKNSDISLSDLSVRWANSLEVEIIVQQDVELRKRVAKFGPVAVNITSR